MRWEDERYVRVYTRDTADWVGLSWDAQSLLMHLFRKVDRAGILHLGRRGVDGLAPVLGHAEANPRIKEALQELLDDGCVQLSGSELVIPNFIEAQESKSSDAQRKRDQRERDRDKLVSDGQVLNSAGQDITATASRTVTDGHTRSRPVTPDVTRGHDVTPHVTPSRAVPSLAVPTQAEPGQKKKQLPLPSRELPAPVKVERPTLPEADWLGQDFQRWAQFKRSEAGLVPEDPLPILALEAWWGLVREAIGPQVRAVQRAFIAFGDDSHWQKQKPPLPFRAFVKQWRSYMPQSDGVSNAQG